MTQFTDLGLAAPILKALDDEGYTTPTPIQTKAIPALLEGSDLLGIAQTGTGKTAAFALPILHKLAANRQPAPRKGCHVLVLSPTRELASQIADSFRVYGRHLGLSVTTIFGGVPQRPQIRTLSQGVDVVIATPGRLLDHVGQRNIDLTSTRFLVLDEADQMLDLGFVKPIRTIVSKLPKKRQSLFFSATMPKEITKLANEFLDNPVKVTVTPVASTVDRVNQRVIQIEAPKKRALLAELLADQDMARTIVFTRTKRGADRVVKYLDGQGINAAAIHGNKSQRQREIALNAFRKAKINVLIATDIAARGIDIDDVTHVVNFELPEIPESYVHRIGRTARAGASGSAISLVDSAERNLLRAIERLIRQTIDTEDRRGDKTLVATAVVVPRHRDPRANDSRGSRGNGPSRKQYNPMDRSGKATKGKPAPDKRRKATTGNATDNRASKSAGNDNDSSLTNVAFLRKPSRTSSDSKDRNRDRNHKSSAGGQADDAKANKSRNNRGGQNRNNTGSRRRRPARASSNA